MIPGLHGRDQKPQFLLMRLGTMESLIYHFPVSGVETYLFLPPLVMFCISTLVSMGGVTGAFILIPFQISVLGYTGPGVSATNFVYNIIAIPLGVYKHIRDGKLSGPLFAVIMIGTLPGVLLGYYVRVHYLPDPAHFKIFVGFVLLYLGARTFFGAIGDFRDPATGNRKPAKGARLHGGTVGARQSTIHFGKETYTFPTPYVFIMSLIVGVIGGAYGIGGGAIMAPFCIAVLRLPAYVVAGAALSSTWVTSVVGALFYAFIPMGTGVATQPDWLLGGLFGLGGMLGVYTGAHLQKYVPGSYIKAVLSVAILGVAGKYLSPLLY